MRQTDVTSEADRLSELHSFEILDTPPDPRFDMFVRLATRLYDVPVALISLVDRDRNWFKAACGLTDPSAPREASFCTQVVRRPDAIMVVEDATLDPRFVDSPFVTGASGIRFYAGAPIVARDGHALGSLCIIDRKPRVLDEAGRRTLADLASAVSSVLELHRSSNQLHKAATHDRLTGLANRALFDDRLIAAVEASLAGTPCAVLCLDLDRFKAVNDTHGHAGGDALLVEVARRLRGVVRASDLPVRMGGDEFNVLLSGPFPPDLPQLFAERIMAALAEPFSVEGETVPISASIGFAVAPADGQDAATLLRAADMALYRAKAAGRGIIVGPESPTRPAASSRTMEDDLRIAIDTDAFVLHWQPYMDLRSGRVIGQEALLRWIRPGHGPVSPAVFIPLAERVGLVDEIDSWVLRHACRAAAAWPSGMQLSVNISPVWFYLGDLTGLVARVLSETGLPPDRLALELTERTLTDHPEMVRQHIAELSAMGVELAVDDFGVGYSSLALLKDFVFRKLKLDRSFVAGIGQDGRADAVARAVLALARALDMTVCAEGVETMQQLDVLRAEGCDLAQGYLLGRPVAVPVFEPFRSYDRR